MKTLFAFVVGLIAAVALLVVGFAVAGAVVMIAWNFLAPIVWAAAPVLSYPAAIAITVLIWVLKTVFVGSK